MNQIIDQTKRWINKVVIGLNLCPFAKFPFDKNLIKYKVVADKNLEKLMKEVLIELNHLITTPAEEVETTLVITPNFLASFEDYLNALSSLEELLEQLKLNGIIQIASFHPKYQFAGSGIDDVENYTNRSPYPMFHLLREDSLEKAIENYQNPEEIPEINMEIMRTLGLQKIKAILNDIRTKN
ncbi:MAG: DUF1415 domain-containing protein [Bacteroidetes bacterium]|jgi:hypothetical protein|nr:DUF1415 domain-containing protein [Bacteroidota bacterium]